jgi:hypothetical protein
MGIVGCETADMERAEADSISVLLSRARAAVMTQLARLQEVTRELQDLITIRSEHRWSGEEFSQYLLLRQEEHDAHRRFVAASDWFEGVLRRIAREGNQEGEKRDH